MSEVIMFDHSETLKSSLLSAFKDKGPAYQPRTQYLDDNQQPIHINRLIFEDSPYLLQHAHNPVDWFPWGDEAFAKAKAENKPVFLSIGYSTCHWCHVMEEESFDNEEIAKHMNEFFICIKVDRECHPDVDTYYMTAVMMMQGHGGWPMSSFLTPERKPFFGGTYYQPAQFITLMSRVDELWNNQSTEILKQADSITAQVAGAMQTKRSLNEIGTNVIDITAQSIMNHHDEVNGGFGQAPKFPNEPYLYFLLEYAILSGKEDDLNAVIKTLHIQSCGGIYDQIAGGFHRYATDQNWLIPHFEKMLYNQANLSYVFAQAHTITGAKDFKRVACETLDYVNHEMTNGDGSFYSATDADSEGEEGLFFIWDKSEIESLLKADAEEFIKLYQVTTAGNFEGKNILNLKQAIEDYANENNIDYVELIDRLATGKKTLWEAREKRVPPLRDDKIITAWNAMMIRSFAYVGQQLNRQDYIDIAIRAAKVLIEKNKTEDGLLSRSSLAGQASIPALQEDYAYLAEALLQIYDATQDRQWLDHAAKLSDVMIESFWDKENGGFFMGSQSKDNLLPASPKEINDNATSSGNSVALRTLQRLARRTGAKQYQATAQQLIMAYSHDITQRPYICSYMMCGMLEMFVGEQSHQQWCADGNIHISASCNKVKDNYKLVITITIAEEWHLNQVPDGFGNDVPVSVQAIKGWTIDHILYPAFITKTLGFQTEPVDVFEGTIQITADLSNENKPLTFPKNLLKLKLGLQVCNEQECLAPESVNCVIPVLD
tara:strand:+ start:13621 stop:15939 length:2319 start_codon:yes stop_codon:yes gene_type:complete